ncbi:pentatricopeptide repeat-containing protein At1g62930, chloroplastic-like [Telopea speciosissima]|uniref:pentatricopeptide repeat-containing protein At1g62930, chloroplastic-like n=1 Tax=Telopea speciosissima TaxID=54955 RepID=UPI001CC5DE81|nr:pentatricopeptide repeat-containing protein At1g62930, chloroplastic-like [Telopea speciosissima]
MRFCSSTALFSRLFSRSSLSGSVSAAQATLSFNATHKEVNPDHYPALITKKDTSRILYLKHFCSLVNKLSTNHRDYGALRALDSMLTKTHYLDSATSVLVIEGLSRLRKLGRAMAVLSNLRKSGKVSDYFLYSLVILCLVKEGRVGESDTVWNEVFGSELSWNRRIDASDFVIYLSKFGKSFELERISERVLMGGGALREQSYIALIGALCRENKTLLVKKVLQEMKNQGMRPDDLTYLIMFQSFCKKGDLVEADSVLRKLIRREYSMDICIYGSFIYGLCKSAKLREADKLFRKLIRKDHAGVSGVGNLKMGKRAIFQLDCHGAVPEIMAYECYCRSLCAVGRLDDAETLLKEMLKKRTVPQICVYKAFIKALFRAGRSEDAIRFFNVEKKRGFIAAEEIGASVVAELCEMGNVNDAWRIFNEFIVSSRFVPATSIVNCILSGYLKVGRLAEAESLFESIQKGSFTGLPDVSTYTVMVDGYCKQGNIIKALCIFEELLKNNLPLNGTLYEVIIRGLSVCGRVEEAHKYLNEMIDNSHLASYVEWKVLFDSTFGADGYGISLG